MTGDIVQAAKFIGAGLSMIGALGGGIGIGLSVHGALGRYGPKSGYVWKFIDQHDFGYCFL